LLMLRLMGKKPMYSYDDPIVNAVLPPCHRTEAEKLDTGISINPAETDKHKNLPDDEESVRFRENMAKYARLMDRDAALELPGIVDRAIARLERLAAGPREREAADAAEAPLRLSFDASAQGELMRRYQTSHSR